MFKYNRKLLQISNFLSYLNYSTAKPSSFFTGPLEFKTDLGKKLRISLNLKGPSAKTVSVEQICKLKRPLVIDGNILNRIVELVNYGIDSLSPKEICILLGYCAACNFSHDKIYTIMADHVIHSNFIAKLDPQGVATTLNSFSKINGRFEGVFDAFARHLVSHPKLVAKFNPQAIAMTLNAFAKSKFRRYDLFVIFGDLIVKKQYLLRRFSTQGLALTLNSFSKLGINHPNLFCLISSTIISNPQLLAQFNAQDMAIIANSFSKLNTYDERLLIFFQRYLQKEQKIIEKFKAKEFALILNAFSKVTKRQAKTFKLFGDRLSKDVELMNQMTGTNIALILTAFSKLQIPHRRMYQVTGDRIIKDSILRSGMSFRDIACTCYAFATVKTVTSVNAVKVLLNHLVNNPNIVHDGRNDALSFFQISGTIREMELKDERIISLLSIYTFSSMSNKEFSAYVIRMLVTKSFKMKSPKTIRVLFLDRLPSASTNAFNGPQYEIEEFLEDCSEAALVKKIQEFQIVCLSRERPETVLTDEVLRSAHRLLAIGVFGQIRNQVDIEVAKSLGIPVFTAPYQHQASAAELIISQIILLSRQIGDRSMEIHQGNWQKTSTNCNEVRGKTIGIIGYGHVGSQLGVMAEALSIKVLFFDTMSLMPIGNAVAVNSMEELLQRSDFVSVNVSSLDENRHLISKPQLDMMKKGAFLINTSYGDAVDAVALAEAINSGHLGGAAIDAHSTTCTPEKGLKKFRSPLQNVRNVILTPNYASLTTESSIRAGSETTAAIVRYYDDGATFGSINFPSVAAWPLKAGNCRIVSMHRNQRGVLREIDNILSDYNVGKQVLDTKDNVGYLIADVDAASVSTEIVSQMAMMAATIRTRIIAARE